MKYKPTEELREEINTLIEDMIVNIQDGVAEANRMGQNIDYHTADARFELIDALEALIAAKTTEARIDELQRFDLDDLARPLWTYDESGDMAQTLTERVAELQSLSQKGKQ